MYPAWQSTSTSSKLFPSWLAFGKCVDAMRYATYEFGEEEKEYLPSCVPTVGPICMCVSQVIKWGLYWQEALPVTCVVERVQVKSNSFYYLAVLFSVKRKLELVVAVCSGSCWHISYTRLLSHIQFGLTLHSQFHCTVSSLSLQLPIPLSNGSRMCTYKRPCSLGGIDIASICVP